MSSSSGITSPVKAATQGGRGNGAQIVQIIKLPEGLNNSAKAFRLEGQITSQNTQNGTVRIETEKGAIEVKVKGNRQPQVGQKIEIEIPAGRQPRQATIRTDPTPQNVNQQNQTPSTRSKTNPNTAYLATRVTAPPSQQPQAQPQQQGSAAAARQDVRSNSTQSIPAALQESLSTQNAGKATQPARVITPEALVRLLSVSPAQAQNIAKEFVSSLPAPVTNIIDKTVFLAGITAKNIISQTVTQNPLLQASGTINQVQSPLTNGFIGQTQPSLQTTLQQTTFLQPTTLNATQPLTTNQTVSSSLATSTATTTQILQTATMTPVTFDPANPIQSNIKRLGQIDINIAKITTPNVKLTPPAIPNLASPSPIPAATQFAPAITSANTATSLSAQVTGFTTQGLPLITVQGIGGGLPQSFVLQQAGSNLQLGSQLQITPKNGVPIAGQISSTATQAVNNPLLQGFQWPALDELYNSLLKVSPQAAAALTRSLPNAGNPAQIGAAAMVFIAAMKSGNFDLLLGDKKIDLLQQIGRKNILSGLTQDSARAAPESASSSEWRAVPMPMFWDSEIHKITLYTRHENQDNKQEGQNENNQTRFIFDLNLTRMGDVQIDGLIKDKRLDLIIRAHNAFSEPMQQTMRMAYTSALNQTELSGELNFQGSVKNWVHVQQTQEQLGLHI